MSLERNHLWPQHDNALNKWWERTTTRTTFTKSIEREQRGWRHTVHTFFILLNRIPARPNQNPYCTTTRTWRIDLIRLPCHYCMPRLLDVQFSTMQCNCNAQWAIITKFEKQTKSLQSTILRLEDHVVIDKFTCWIKHNYSMLSQI